MGLSLFAEQIRSGVLIDVLNSYLSFLRFPAGDINPIQSGEQEYPLTMNFIYFF
jgi:hypothetical protein